MIIEKKKSNIAKNPAVVLARGGGIAQGSDGSGRMVVDKTGKTE